MAVRLLLVLGILLSAFAHSSFAQAVVPSIASLSSSQTVMEGTNLTLTVSVNGTTPFTYQWRKDGTAIGGETNPILVLNAIRVVNAGSYTVVVTNSAGSVTSSPILIAVTPATPPSFYSQPSNTSVTVGNTLNLSVGVNGTSPFTFEWRKGTTLLATTTSGSYSKADAQIADGGSYTVTVVNIAGSATSSAFTVTVNAPVLPAISSQPQNRTVATAASFSLSVGLSAGSSPLSYQWKKDGVAISGATNYYYDDYNAQAGDAGSYTVTITNAAGSVTSAAATVTVQAPVAPTITSISNAVTVAVGNSIWLEVSASGTAPLTYQWRKDGVAIAGATSSYLSRSITQLSDGGSYTVVVTNEQGSVTSTGVTVTVTTVVPQLPVITQSPPSVTVNYGEYVYLSVSVTSNTPVSYQWRKNGVAIPGATSSYYSLSGPVTETEAGNYTVVATNSQGSVTSEPCNVAVLPLQAPVVLGAPLSRVVSQGGEFSLYVEISSTTGVSYQWRKDGVAIPGATSSGYSKSNVASSDSGSYTVVVSNAAGTVTSSAATVTVVSPALPLITQHPASGSVLPGQYFGGMSVGVTSVGSTTYQWYLNDVAIAGQTSSSIYIGNAQPSHAGTYKVTVTNAAGSVTSNNAVLTVDTNATRPIIIYTTGNSVVAIGNSGYVFVDTVVTPTSVVWKKDGVTVAGATSRSLSLYGFTAAQAGSYVAIVTTPGGTATSQPIVLSVQNLGVVPAIQNQPGAENRFVGQSASFDVSAVGEFPLSYQWRKDGVAISGATSSSFYISTVAASHAGAYSVVVTNRNGSVTSDAAPLVVLTPAASPPVIRTHPGSRTVTIGSSSNYLSVQLSTSMTVTYQWRKDGVAIPGATSSSYSLGAISAATAGRYSVVVSNASGSTTSYDAVVTVTNSLTGPGFTTQPQNVSVYAGGNVTFTANAVGSGTVTYQWRKNSVDIPGATGATLGITSVPMTAAGSYSVLATDVNGSTLSSTAFLSVINSTAPTISRQPVSTTAFAGANVTFTATATGTPSPGLQWLKNDAPISGANSGTLTLSNVQAGDAASYTFRASNVAGSATSSPATLTVYTEPLSVPSIVTQPANAAVMPGGTATFSVTAAGYPAPGYQWRKNGADIAGANSNTYTIANVQAGDAASYSVLVSNIQGSVTSASATLTIGSELVGIYHGTFGSGDAWALQVYPDGTAIFIATLAARNQAIVARGFVVNPTGQFTFGSPVTIAADGASGPAALYYGGVVNGQITATGVTGQLPALGMSFSGVAAPNGSASSVAGCYQAVPLVSAYGEVIAIAAPDGVLTLVALDTGGVRGGRGSVAADGNFSLMQGSYSYQGNVSAAGSVLNGSYQRTGGATVTIASPAAAGGIERLAAVSTRGLAGSGSRTLIAGFVIVGNAPKDVLVRGIGPGLTRSNVAGALVNPRLKIFSGSTLILENGDWNQGPSSAFVADAAARTGAAPLTAGSLDAALLAHLNPGVYTAQVSSDDGSTGVALVEVYDASPMTADAPKLLALSTRGDVGAGDNILILGVVVTGSAPKKMIIRGVGPTLGSLGVEGALADPELRIYRGAELVGENDNWSADSAGPLITSAGISVGLSALPQGSKDAAMLLYLAPGTYTVQLRGVSGTTGVGLVEVYEVP